MKNFSLFGTQYVKEVIPLINSAQKSIEVVVYDWRWYSADPANPCQKFNIAMINAIRRGVYVRACVNSKAISYPLIRGGLDIRIPITKKLMHSKFIIIDDKVLIVGSHNFTHSAFCQNIESSVVLHDKQLVEDYSLFFENLWQT